MASTAPRHVRKDAPIIRPCEDLTVRRYWLKHSSTRSVSPLDDIGRATFRAAADRRIDVLGVVDVGPGCWPPGSLLSLAAHQRRPAVLAGVSVGPGGFVKNCRRAVVGVREAGRASS